MSSKSRQCPFSGCSRLIDPELFFACGRHWYTLNAADQASVYEAYYRWKAGEIDGDELRRIQQDVLGIRGTA